MMATKKTKRVKRTVGMCLPHWWGRLLDVEIMEMPATSPCGRDVVATCLHADGLLGAMERATGEDPAVEHQVRRWAAKACATFYFG